MAGGGVHSRGHVWQGGVHGRGHAWQGCVCDRGACMPPRQILRDTVN